MIHNDFALNRLDHIRAVANVIRDDMNEITPRLPKGEQDVYLDAQSAVLEALQLLSEVYFEEYQRNILGINASDEDMYGIYAAYEYHRPTVETDMFEPRVLAYT